ncbi:MAG: hypothetical protein ACE5GU_14960, partial [Candidatus Scalinduaceae bacterium]
AILRFLCSSYLLIMTQPPFWRAVFPVYSDVYSSSSDIPKQFAIIFYSKGEKLCVVKFIGNYDQRFLENKKRETTRRTKTDLTHLVVSRKDKI